MGNSCSQNKKKKMFLSWDLIIADLASVFLFIEFLSSRDLMLLVYWTDTNKITFLSLELKKKVSIVLMVGPELCLAVRERTVSAGCQQGREDQFSMLFSSENISKNKPSFQPEQLIGCPLPPPMWSVPSLRASKKGKVSTFSDLEHKQNREKKFLYI